MPVVLAFGLDTGLQTVDIIFDLMFMMDIWFNFHTAFYDAWGNVYVSLNEIARNYIKNWFIFDALAAVPVDLITMIFFSGGGTSPVELQYLSLLKFYRIVRVGKIVKYINAPKYARMMRIVQQAKCRGWVGIEWEGGKPGEDEGIKLTRDLLVRCGGRAG